HVDHGKTTLLDAIRESSVVETEAGGITQHIGAYQVHQNGRTITFLDTPGHEAFTPKRPRGAKVTDIAVLVVAADDGVMPQTRESLSHARAAGVPVVVAINKVDLPDANPDRVKNELAADGLQPEEWGGTTQFAQVSAKQKTGLDDLLERVLLVADAELELRANPSADASGPIIESRLDVGRGPVATMLVQRGTLRVGDAVVAGDGWGKVRALYNFRGEKIAEAKPGEPVEILGFDKPPPAGELCRVVENDRHARHLAQVRGERLRREQLAQQSTRGVSLERLFEQMQEGEVRELNLIVKGDVGGSVEAAISELAKIQHPEVGVNVIHQGVGPISEGDVMLAAASNAMVVGFNVRANAEARAAADREGVEIRTYRVIYQLTEDIEQALVGMLSPVSTEEVLGEAEVRALFRVSRLGTIAGCMVTGGVVRRGARVRIAREGAFIHETTVAQLKRFKDDVREVAEGFECGILLEGFNDVKEGDVLEVFEVRQVERTGLDA
ncbi:MAG: translation initiation factor IF-2, partial [Thermoleophilia bacterium]|nr:translation initiation factor IF-2 [Thermoleophilia bacterium]